MVLDSLISKLERIRDNQILQYKDPDMRMYTTGFKLGVDAAIDEIMATINDQRRQHEDN